MRHIARFSYFRMDIMSQTYRTESDEILMIAYQEGDLDAFETLYIRHHKSLYRYAMKLSVNDEAAEAFYLAVWTQVIKDRANFRSDWSFANYLYSLAHEQLMYDYHAINKKSVISFAEQQQPFNSLDCGKDASLQDIFAALPLPLVEAYHLQYDVKLNVELAADSAAISVPTFSFRIREATRLLLEALGKQEEPLVNNLTEAGLVSLYKNTATERISTELDNSVLRIAHIDSSWLARSASKIKFYLLIAFTAFIIVAIAWWMVGEMSKPRDITVTIDTTVSTASAVENVAASRSNAAQLALQASEASIASPVITTPVRPRKPRVVASSVSATTAETESLLPPVQPAHSPDVEKPIQEVKPEPSKVEQPTVNEAPVPGPPKDNHLID